jgi:uncharacterized membrane protein YhhN
MNPALLLGGAGATVIFTCVLLVAEARHSIKGIWFAKPLAAAGFIACAIGFGALNSDYGRLILAGLCLSWLGDVLLISGGRGRAFLVGIVSFALAHCAYALAFTRLTPDLQISGLALAAMLVLSALFMRWVWPYLQGPFRWAVLGYVLIIAVMVALGAGASMTTASLAFVAGAFLFALSDVFVARDRFVQPDFGNRRWGLPLYFLAQLILAASVASPAVMP